MQTILKGLRDLEGVNGTFLADTSGTVLAFNAASVYDASLLTQVSRAVANAIDSVKLIHEDWDTITTQFSEGRLLIRNIPTAGRKGAVPLTLSLIADSRLNPAFATVAVRVAISKIKAMADANGGVLSMPTVAVPNNSIVTPQQAMAATSPGIFPGATGTATVSASSIAVPVVAGSGLNWSGFGGSSTLAASGVAVADAASSAVLTTCTKYLAKAVGPMAKIFVKEAVRKISSGQPFSKSMLAALVTELEKEIEDQSDAADFRKNAAKLS